MHSNPKSRQTRDTTINIRATQQQRDLIDKAAESLGKNRSDFMLESACKEAESALLERVYIPLDTESFEEFSELLDNPPPPTEKLRQMLLTKAPWE